MSGTIEDSPNMNRRTTNTKVDDEAGATQLEDPVTQFDYSEAGQAHLTWRSWVVVFVTSFASLGQILATTAAGGAIAFIIRDIGGGGLAGWIVQGPLLVQGVLSPIVGRLSDVIDRKYLAIIPPVISVAGAVVSAKASSMNVLIGGGILIGVTLSSISIVQAIPSEVLPLKYRAVANACAFLGGMAGGLIGDLGAGAAIEQSVNGWRVVFWIQTSMFAATALGLWLFYNPPKQHESLVSRSWKKLLWQLDPIGSPLFMAGSTLVLLSLDWAGGTYPWRDAHVIGPLVAGLVILIGFGLYEWKGRDDGIISHHFFDNSPNFSLAMFAFAVEGWIFYSAVNNVTPLIILHVGFQSNPWDIAVRQLAYIGAMLFMCVPISLYATWRKDLKTPLLFCFTAFLAVTICYANLKPWMNHAQIAFSAIAGIGTSGPLILLVAMIQFTSPAEYLSTATGLAYSARAIGGAFGSAVLDSIINSRLAATYDTGIASVAVGAGLPSSSVPALIGAIAAGSGFDTVPGLNEHILDAALSESYRLYANAYSLAWASIIPFVVLAMVAIFFMKGVKELMTDYIPATVERSTGKEQDVI